MIFFLLALLSKYNILRKTFNKTQKHKTLLQEQQKIMNFCCKTVFTKTLLLYTSKIKDNFALYYQFK